MVERAKWLHGELPPPFIWVRQFFKHNTRKDFFSYTIGAWTDNVTAEEVFKVENYYHDTNYHNHGPHFHVGIGSKHKSELKKYFHHVGRKEFKKWYRWKTFYCFHDDGQQKLKKCRECAPQYEPK